MQSAIDILVAMDFAVHSSNQLVQQIREYIEESKTPLEAAHRFIFNMTSIPVVYTDLLLARVVAQSIAIDAITIDSYTFEDSISRGEHRYHELVKKQPECRLKYEPSETPTFSTPKSTTSIAVAEGISTKVEVKADGKIKKGGKQVLAAEMYALHVTNSKTPMSNQEFIALLMKELGMTKAGATTYRYNLAKAGAEKAGK